MDKSEENSKSNKKEDRVWGSFFMLFGLYLLVGSYVAIMDSKWPIFMPPQLDLIAIFLELFSEQTAAYIGGLIIFFIGLGSLWLGFRVLKS